jgi:hypothetical protein
MFIVAIANQLHIFFNSVPIPPSLKYLQALKRRYPAAEEALIYQKGKFYSAFCMY